MLYSFGHGTIGEPHEAVERLQWLRAPTKTVIIDARSHPESRWPLWNLNQERVWLPSFFGDFEWRPGLGGWRREHAIESVLVETMAEHQVDLRAYEGRFPTGLVARHLPGYGTEVQRWTVKGFWDYEWFMSTIEFQDAAWQLAEQFGGPDKPDAAFFCCETLWWKCHRSMIADYMGWLGVQVVHLTGRTRQAHVRQGWESRLGRYEQEVLDSWDRYKTEKMTTPTPVLSRPA